MYSRQPVFLLVLLGMLGPALSLGRAQDTATKSNSTSEQVASSEQGASIDAVVVQVKQALADVQTTLANSDLPALKQVKISLQTVAVKKAGFSLKLWVISIGDTVEKNKTQQIDIVLTPPSAGAARPVRTRSLTQDLEDAIVSVAAGVKNARSGPIPLNVQSVDIQIGFTVKNDLNGGVAFTITPVTVDFSGDISQTAVHTLIVSFAPPR